MWFRRSASIAFSIKDDFVGAMTEAVDRGGTEDAVRKGVGPLGDVKIGSHNGAPAFVAF